MSKECAEEKKTEKKCGDAFFAFIYDMLRTITPLRKEKAPERSVIKTSFAISLTILAVQNGSGFFFTEKPPGFIGENGSIPFQYPFQPIAADPQQPRGL